MIIKGTPRGEVLPYTGYISMCDLKGYGFSASLVLNRAWFLHSSRGMGVFLRRNHFITIEKKVDKSPSQIMFMVI